MNQTKAPSLSDLIALLDPETLDLLTARLHQVAVVQEEAPEQLLFSFIEDSLAVYEEGEIDEKKETAIRAFFDQLYSK